MIAPAVAKATREAPSYSHGQGGERFRDIAEVFEKVHGNCLALRTEALPSFVSLGPPDLVHTGKSNNSNAPLTGTSGSTSRASTGAAAAPQPGVPPMAKLAGIAGSNSGKSVRGWPVVKAACSAHRAPL